MRIEVKIPDIAENVESGTVARILVSKGENIKEGQSVAEVETDKATTDIPSTHDGKVESVEVKEGDEVRVGTVIIVLEAKEEGEVGKEREEKEEKKEEKKEEEGEGLASEAEKAEESVKKSSAEDRGPEQISEETRSYADIAAAPSVRRLARELGVDLRKVSGTGPGNRITSDDVRSQPAEKKESPETARKMEGTGLPDFSRWGHISREKVSNIRKLTGQRMYESWQSVPHVTQYDEADVTRMEEFRQQNKEVYEKAGGKLTITAILLKISAFALQRFPGFNSSIDFDRGEIIYKHYCNIGVAVDTEQGLIVPVIRDADRKSLQQISVELTEIAEKARNKKIDPGELQGGNFTISNLGGIGGTAFSPIVYAPQVAILGVSRSQYRQVWHQDEFKRCLMLPLSLSYDHRAIDGAEGARFLRWICNVLEDPYTLLK
jgi:pyruvate dehydrogenase E2 component (dihydrolipoamide acetyltransferase)